METLSTDYKTVAAVLAVVVGLTSFIPYFVAMFRRETTPHAYTWLVWSITQGTAALGVWSGGGGGILSLGLALAAGLVFVIFLLSFKYGTKNITKGDTVILIIACIAILVWWQLGEPVLALFMICAIDGIAYFPTYRKVYEEPWSENLWSWIQFTFTYILSLIALEAYNLLTVPYIALCLSANVLLIVLALWRRQRIPKPV